MTDQSAEIVVAGPPVLADLFARRCASSAAHAIAARGAFSLFLPGGSAARALLRALSAAPLDWGRVDIFWIDERAVPADHPDSNFGLARRLLGHRAAGTDARLHPMYGESGDLAGEADAYARELEETLGRPPQADVILLGAGEDGHVCSLFPGSPALEERARWVLPVTDAPKPPPRRLTITMPVLEAARAVYVAAFGAAKAAPVANAVRRSEPLSPLAMVLRRPGRTCLLLDDAAAAGLASGS